MSGLEVTLLSLLGVLAVYAALMTYLFWSVNAQWGDTIEKWGKTLERGDYFLRQWRFWQEECRRQGLRARKARKRARHVRHSEAGV